MHPRTVRNLLICIAFACMAALPGAARAEDAISLDLATARVVAIQAIAEGNFPLARAIADGLLQADPDDYDALMILAAAQSGLGADPAAAAAAARAFRAAKTDQQRAQAARLAAAARFRGGNYMRSEWWLRRAANAAEEPALRQLIGAEFVKVRRANPLTLEASLSFAPSSNVNNGSSSDTIYIWDLPFTLSPDAQALSGYEATLGLGLGYRLSESATHLTEFGGTLFGRFYALSSAAKRAAPDADAGDYSFGVVEAFLSHRQILFPTIGSSGVQALVGQNWYGGDPLTRYARLTLSQDTRLGERTLARVQASAEHQDGQRGDENTRIHGLDGTVTHLLGRGDVIRLTMGARRARSSDVTLEYDAVRGGLRYALAAPVLGADLSLELSAEARDYDVTPYGTDGRRDRTIAAGVTAVMTQVEYFGFSPSVTVEASRTTSNISLYERELLGLRLGFRSNF